MEKELTHNEESNEPLITNDENSEKISASESHQSNITFTLPEKVVSSLYSSTKGSLNQLKKTKRMKSRTVLWWLVFVGFAINYMIRINLNITIVDMVSQKKSLSNSSMVLVTAACFNGDKEITMLSPSNKSYSDVEIANSWRKFSLEREVLKSLSVSIRNGFKIGLYYK